MSVTISSWHIAGILLFSAALIGYAVGWRRLRRAHRGLATWPRLVVFTAGLVALAAALIWPLPGWSNYLLTMRALQKVFICMVAAPLLWTGCPLHVMAWGMRGRVRRSLVTVQDSTTRPHRLVKLATQPLFTWFFFVGAFLLWHDPQWARFILGDNWLHYVTPWVLLLAALLFWWPVVNTGPRLHRSLPAWVFIIYLVSVEIANMVTGMTIAFNSQPLYAYYTAVRAPLGGVTLPLSQANDQMIGGAIIWVFGSFVYVTGVVATLYRLFRREEDRGEKRGEEAAPTHLVNWDDQAKFIAPGLEHRVAENRLRNVDLSHH